MDKQLDRGFMNDLMRISVTFKCEGVSDHVVHITAVVLNPKIQNFMISAGSDTFTFFFATYPPRSLDIFLY